jgi:hypothetical protein
MNRKHDQYSAPIDVLLMLGDGPLSIGIENLLLKKNILTHKITHCTDEDSINTFGQKRKKVVLVSTFCCQNSSKCLVNLLSNPDIEEIFMIDANQNRVQVLKRQQVILTNKNDFEKLF